MTTKNYTMVFENYLIICMISRLKYFNEGPSKSNTKIQEQLFKTSYTQHDTKMSLYCKALDSNTNSHEQHNKSRTVANSQNEIIISPDIPTLKNEDFPGSSTNDHNAKFFMVINIIIIE